MAPLLGRKPYPLVKPLPEPPGPDQVLYIIQHTKEAFTNKDEYEARLQRYEEHIWTCKSTGSSQLTHKEAWDEEQEVTELLQEEFPLWFEKPVLEMVHHNTLSLDKLVDQAWVEILTKYAIGEECDYLVGSEKSARVKVLEVQLLETPENESAEKKLEGACDSPSSNKENASQENQKELQPKEEENRRSSLCDRARRSPRKLPTTVKQEKRRWVMPKFLPHKYTIKLLDEDKIINNIPAGSLFRTERPPNKEIMRYFIRHNALRLGVGESAPWVVEDELVKKYNLPSKFDDFLLDPQKYMADNSTRKRKSLSSAGGKPAKKVCVEVGKVNKKEVKKQQQKGASPNVPLSPSVLGHVLMKKGNGSPLKVKNTGSLKSGSSGESDSSVSSGFQKGVKSSKKQGEKKPSEAKKSQNGQKPSKKGEKVKRTTPQHVTKAGSSSSAGPGTSKPGKPLPPMALHLMRYYKEHKDNEDKKNALSCLISKVAKVLTPDDRARLPEELRDVVEKRWELLEYKRRWAAMSEEEKQEAMRKKREEIREKLRERAKERREKEMLVRREQQRRYEDQELEGKSLPNFKLVDTPDGLPNTQFGDIAMVVDFLNCYDELLMPDDQYPVTAAALMEALAAEKGGFLYLNRVLVILLQTLLQDELAEGYSELDMALSEIPLTMYSVSELVRLCLRPSDSQAEGSGRSSDDWPQAITDDGAGVANGELLEKLETAEVFELSAQEKVSLLVALCNRILMTYSVEEHVERTQQRSAELWKERLAALKEANDRVRAEKQRRKEMMEAKGGAAATATGWVKVEGGSAALAKADRKKLGGGEKEKVEETAMEPQTENIISAVKSRRLQSIQAKKDKEEQERLNKERMEKEAEEERVRKQKATAERVFQEGIAKAKLVMRRAPLGTDRNHNRYWLFSDTVPGLYIEKGWVHDSIDYSFTLPPNEQEEEDDDEDDEVEEQEDGDSPDVKEECSTEGSQQGVTAVPEASVERTVPKRGQNLWFVCDSVMELEELMESLHPQGVRECELKAELQYRYQDIVHSIHVARKASLRLKTCDGHQELLENLRSDVIEVALRLQKGGLGYMDDLKQFEEKVNSLEKLKDFGECVITLQETVIRKFLQGFMAPKKKVQVGEETSRTEEVDDEKKLAEEARVATAVEKWKAMTREVQTFSRMHVLLGMLDACIKWDMSAENARCKVCRKKGDDDKLILCDECNKAFHLFCLRPALYRIPDGEWLCPACQPAGARRALGRTYEDTESEDERYDDEDEESSEDDHDDTTFTGHYLRSRKSSKRKGPCRKVSCKSVSKKCSPPRSRPGRPKGSPSNLADIDELVRLSSRTGVRREALELEKCEEILQKLLKFRYSWPFREPVSPQEAEDYLDIISHPMDFQTMQRKFMDGQYRHCNDFLEDMKLVFSNAEEYNQPGSAVLSCLAKTEQVFVELLQRLLPALTYHRRHKRIRRNCGREEEEGQCEEEEEHIRGSAKPRRTARREDEGGRHGRRQRRRRRWEEEGRSSPEDDEHTAVLRKSKRLAAGPGRKDYREVESDSDKEEGARTMRKSYCRAQPRSRVGGVQEGGSDEDRLALRRSKRQKQCQ